VDTTGNTWSQKLSVSPVEQCRWSFETLFFACICFFCWQKNEDDDDDDDVVDDGKNGKMNMLGL
jgi:hypothetical protein